MTKALGAVIARWYASDVALGRSIAEDNGEPVEDAIAIEEALGKPCSAADIKALEKHLGSALPASYRAYLALHGKGDKQFGAPLGPADHRKKAIIAAIDWKRSLFSEFGGDDPFAAGAIPFVLDGDSRNMVLFVPPMKRGDMAVAEYDLTERTAKHASLAAYFEAHIALADEIVDKHAKRKRRGGVQSQRDAIDAVLADKPIAKSAMKTVALRLRGKLADGWVPSDAAIWELADRAESERFVKKLRSIPALRAEVALDLADGAVSILQDSTGMAKALPLVELLADCAPKKKTADTRWLQTMNSAIHRAYAVKQFELAARLADVAKPFVRQSQYIHHNAACAYVAVKRYDDALAMCKVAVETGYSQLDKLRTDRDLGPLLKRREFKALFTAR